MVFDPKLEWVDSVVKDACEHIQKDMRTGKLGKLALKPIPREKIEVLVESKALEKMVRGYIAEFIRQSDNGVGDVNNIKSLKDDPNQDFAYWKPYNEQTIAGIIHTKAMIKKAIDMDFTKDETMTLCYVVITDCIDKMRKRYYDAGHSDFAKACIAKDTNALSHFIDQCISENGGIL